MAIDRLPRQVETVLVGNGPSALILSFILHGHIPYYNPSRPHPDPLLHQKLINSPCLLNLDVCTLTAHFSASRISYSTHTLPVNVLLDALLRPLADTNPGQYASCVDWHYEPKKARAHIVVGNTNHSGGQWADNAVPASWDIAALSYAEQLSLPGFSFQDHYHSVHPNKILPEFYRPTRREVADYLAAYPKRAGIEDSIRLGTCVGGVERTVKGFHIASHNIDCKNLVLASGTFTYLIPPRPLLCPLKDLPTTPGSDDAALLVIGSGFTAADIIVSAPSNRKIIHIYKWDPDRDPSPLRACHPSAYPEYAGVYRRMKIAARSILGESNVSPFRNKKFNPFFESRPDHYEGLPNTLVVDVSLHGKFATVRMRRSDGQEIERKVSGLEYVIGRRGSLEYLTDQLQSEVLGRESCSGSVSSHSLSHKVGDNLEVASRVFAIGSLVGDSLIRFSYGACLAVASQIIAEPASSSIFSDTTTTACTTCCPSDDLEKVPVCALVDSTENLEVKAEPKACAQEAGNFNTSEAKASRGCWPNNCAIS